MKNYSSVINFVHGSVWAILPAKLDAMMAFLELKAGGLAIDAATIDRLAAERRQPTSSMARNIAVLPIVGVISQRMSLMSDISGGTSTERLGREFEALVADNSVEAIVLDVDSPGGSYAGTPELAAKIFAARGSKPIVAVANGMAASAAFWLATAADELVVTPSGEVGSHGVVAVHTDYSAANEQEGVKTTYVTYGKYKAELNPDTPLSDESLAELQRRVDEAGEHFTHDLARNRKTSLKNVRENYGQGRMFSGEEAVSRGMADRVDTLDGTIDRLNTKLSRRRSMRAEKERLGLL